MFSQALFWGAILGAVQAGFSLLLFFLGYQTDKIEQGQSMAWIALPITIAVLVLALRDVGRSKDPAGFTWGQGVGAAALVGAFGGVVGAIYTVVHMTFINPDYASYVLDMTRAQLESNPDMPEEAIEQALKFTEMFLTPVAQGILVLIGSPVTCTIMGLILAIFTRRAPGLAPAPGDDATAAA